MNKKKLFRKQQMTFMFLNIIAFTLIFAIFGVIISSVMHQSLFSQVDEELTNYKNRIEHAVSIQKWRINQSMEGEQMLLYPPNPRMLTLVWDEKGDIINQEQLGTRLYEGYFRDLTLNVAQLGEITNLKIDQMYNFRTVTIQLEDLTGNPIYMQMMVNVDAEQNVYRQFQVLLIVCSAIFILLSISASYILSKKTMKPIVHSWNRQTEFVENASHELRTPLTIIQNKLELLLTTPHKRIVDKFDHIALSLSETRRLSKLTSELLTLARADSSETLLEKESINMDDFICQVCTPYRELAELEAKQFTLDLKSQMVIEADKSRLHQLIIILLDNALKYTVENESIQVKTSINHNKLLLEVSDTGIGISEKNQKNIFDRFYREDKVRTRDKGGSGLGLSIAQWIVESHGGDIQVRNNTPKGTTFTVTLPKM